MTTIKELEARIVELEAHIAILTRPKGDGVRDYGPRSEHKMTETDAIRILNGDLKDVSVNDICRDFGFSRGQVYSLRGGYTFKSIKRG